MVIKEKLFHDVYDEKVQEKYNVKFGTRGDPDFIKYIIDNMVGREFLTKSQLVDFVKTLYFDLTGSEMREDSYALCREFQKGSGMSDGIISGKVLEKGGFIDTIAKFYGLE